MAHERAGQLAQPTDLIDIAELVTAYYTLEPDVNNPDQAVAFGTSGHRGSSLDSAFNENHILAITQAIVDYRAEQGTTGAIFVGRDTHALSEPAMVSALEVLLANEVEVRVDNAGRYTPTPAVSLAILTNPGTDGIVITPSHNPPRMAALSTTHQPVARLTRMPRTGLLSVPMTTWSRTWRVSTACAPKACWIRAAFSGTSWATT